MIKKPTPPAALGVFVSQETIEAVLLRRMEDHTAVVQRFVRQRIGRGQFAPSQDLALAVPGLKGADDGDYTLEVGDGSSSGSSTLLPSELASLGVGSRKGRHGGGGTPRRDSAARPSFAPQLKEILQEVHGLGYEHPPIAFCIAPPDVAYVEVPLPVGKREAGGEEAEAPRALSAQQRKQLLAELPEHYPDDFEPDRVAFLPLADDRGARRALALVAAPDEPVASTLTALREQRTVMVPASRFLDAEASAYAALLAHTLRPDPDERTAIVRVGTTDTLVLFFVGTQLQHLERLRSMTTFDAPETICSRVLLQQDEKRVGQLHNVLVAGAGRSSHLIATFQTYYDAAAVEPIQRVLADAGLTFPEDDEHYTRSQFLPALVSGLHLLEGWETAADVNLLPRRLQRRRRELRLPWHTALALLLFVGAVATGIIRHQAGVAELREAQAELARNPIQYPATDPAVLQQRVDSLAQAHATYTHALHILDSLLVGSDRWITTVERIADATARTSGTWVDQITPQGSQAMRMQGHALSRLAVVELARRLSGAIEQLNYEDVGERRVYSYEMVFPTPDEVPAAAEYLRRSMYDAAPPEGPAELHPALHGHD